MKFLARGTHKEFRTAHTPEHVEVRAIGDFAELLQENILLSEVFVPGESGREHIIDPAVYVLDDRLIIERAHHLFPDMLEFFNTVVPTPEAGRHILQGFCSVLKGLSYIHSKGYVHADVKLGNFLMMKDQSFKLCDFMLSKKIGETLDQTGSPHLLDPQLEGGVTPAIDTYSFCASAVWSIATFDYGTIHLAKAGCTFDGSLSKNNLKLAELGEQIFSKRARLLFPNRREELLEILKMGMQERPTCDIIRGQIEALMALP